MKLVVSYIQRHKRYDVSETVRSVPGMTGMTVTVVLGCGKRHIESEQKHPDRFIGASTSTVVFSRAFGAH